MLVIMTIYGPKIRGFFLSCRTDVVTLKVGDNDCSVPDLYLNPKISLHGVLTFMSFFWFRISVA
jgi:hypothetical protein